MTWHRFRPSSEDDSICTNLNCGVVVCDDALPGYSNPCPAVPCDATTNDGVCVFVAQGDGSVCAYCEVPGGKDAGDEEDFIDDGDASDDLGLALIGA